MGGVAHNWHELGTETTAWQSLSITVRSLPSYSYAGERSVDLVEGIKLSTDLVVCPL